MRIAWLVLLVGCTTVHGVDQKADAVLLDVHDKAPGPTAHQTDYSIGAADYRVPIRIQWTLADDKCAGLQTIKIVRTGGPTTTEIYKTELGVGRACNGEDHSEAKVHFCYRFNGAGNKADCAFSWDVFLRDGDVMPAPAP